MGVAAYSMFESSYFSKDEHLTIVSFYILATIVNVFANSLVWTTIIKNRHLKSPMNYLILNLSLADIISGISVYPYLFMTDAGAFFHSPEKQARLCIITEGLSLFWIANGASLLTLCGISFNRFLAVAYPTRQNLRMDRKSVVAFNIFTWIIATACMIPGIISWSYKSQFKTCMNDFRVLNGFVYRIVLLLIGTVLPSTFLILSFLAIVYKVRAIVPIEDARMNSRRYDRMQKAEKMLGILILIYVISWLPFSLYWTLLTTTNYFPISNDGVRLSNQWMRVTALFCTLNGSLNPFVYNFTNLELRRASKLILKNFWFKLTCQQSTENHVVPLQFGQANWGHPQGQAATIT